MGAAQCVTNSTDRLRECMTGGSKNEKYLRDVIYGWLHGGGGDDDVDGGRQLFPSFSEEKRLETWPPLPFLPRGVGC